MYKRQEDIYDPLAERIESAAHYRLFPKKIEKFLSPADERLLKGETVGIDLRGVFKS